ncbi:Putative AC9 transposase [Linum grandiflorum]
MLVNGILKAKCIYCKKVYQAVSTNGTSYLRLHRTKCVQKKIHDGSQKIQGPNYIAKGKTELSANQFNQFFTNVCKLRLQIRGWFEDPSSLIRVMADKMWQKFTKYWDDMHQILAVSVVLDPRYKLQIVEYYAAKFGCDDTAVAAENIKAVLLDLVREYQTKATTNLPSQSRSNIPSSSATDLDFDMFAHQKKKARPTIVTTELDHYLADDLYPRNLGDLDLLAWWKLHGGKYPTLHNIARDLLAILITSVASESAFSSGGRLLDPHRSKLNSNTVEAMMCARSWIQDEARRSGGKCYVHILFILSLCLYFYSIL